MLLNVHYRKNLFKTMSYKLEKQIKFQCIDLNVDLKFDVVILIKYLNTYFGKLFFGVMCLWLRWK